VDRTDLALGVDVLGPLVLRVRGGEVGVPGARRRALLALLALAGERGVSTESLVDSLWPDDPPENAVQALYSLVSRLRRHLGPLADRLERQRTDTACAWRRSSSTPTPPGGWLRRTRVRRWSCGGVLRWWSSGRCRRWRSPRSGWTSCA
jgi:hypothetical protein